MRKLNALTRRWDGEIERREYQLGMLCSVIGNYGYRAPKDALKPSDFVPKRHRHPEPEPDPVEVDRRVERLMSSLPGGYIVKDAGGNVIEENLG